MKRNNPIDLIDSGELTLESMTDLVDKETNDLEDLTADELRLRYNKAIDEFNKVLKNSENEKR